jgi:hypothetical protein
MADFADEQGIQFRDMAQAKQAFDDLEAGNVHPSKEEAVRQALIDFRRNHDPSTGESTIPREADGTPRMEFMDKIGVSADIGQEGARQLLSATKGLGNLTFNTGIMALDMANYLGADEGDYEATINQLRANMVTKREQFEADADDMIVRVTGAESSAFGEFAGGVLPWFAIPNALSTYTRTVAYNGLVGGVGAGIMNEEAKNLEERVGDMKVGTLLGVGTSAVLSAKSGFQHYASRRIQKRFEEDLATTNAQLEQDIQRMLNDPDFSFSMGQITADPFITGLEFGAAHKIQRAAQNERIMSLIDFMNKRSREMSRRGDTEQIAIDLHQTMERISKETIDAAGTQYRAGIDDLITQHGDEIVLDARGYLAKARELAAELRDPAMHGSAKAVPEGLKNHIDFLDLNLNPNEYVRRTVRSADGKKEKVFYDIRNRKDGTIVETFTGRGSETRAKTFAKSLNHEEGGLTVDQLARVLKGNSKLASGETPLFETLQLGSQQNIAAALKGALTESMEGSSGTAIQKLNGIRQSYRDEMVKLNNISNTMLARVFGDESAIFSADEALDRLIGRTPQSLNATREILEVWNPGLLDDIKAVTIRRAVEKSTRPGTQASLVPYDVAALADNLAGPKSRQIGELGAGLFSAAEQAEIKATAQAMRVLKETHMDIFSMASAGRLQDATINFVSRSPEFMARFLTRLFSTGSSIEAILNDPGARESIRRLASTGPDNSKGRLAMSYLITVHAQDLKNQEDDLRTQYLEEVSKRAADDPFRQ